MCLSGILIAIMSYGCLVGGEFLNILTEEAILPRDVWKFEVERTNESDDLVGREGDGNKRLSLRYIGCYV